MAVTGLCKQSIANAIKRLEACGILKIARRLVREVIDGGGFPMTVTRQASNLYAVREPGEHADRLPVRAPVPHPFPRPAFAALANMLGWKTPKGPSLRDRGNPTFGFQNSANHGAALAK